MSFYAIQHEKVLLNVSVYWLLGLISSNQSNLHYIIVIVRIKTSSNSFYFALSISTVKNQYSNLPPKRKNKKVKPKSEQQKQRLCIAQQHELAGILKQVLNKLFGIQLKNDTQSYQRMILHQQIGYCISIIRLKTCQIIRLMQLHYFIFKHSA